MPPSDAPAGTPGRKPRRTRSIDPRQFMEAATTLYTNNRARFATVAEITQEIGCAKGTFYLYYRSVEQMYARIIEAKLTECVDETLRRIDAAATLSQQTALSPDTLADAIVSPFLVDKVQINFAFRLIGGFTEMLAREDALNLRLCVVALMRRIADRIEHISQGLLSGEAARATTGRCYAAIMGLWQYAYPSPGFGARLSASVPNAAYVDFEHEAFETVRALWCVAINRALEQQQLADPEYQRKAAPTDKTLADPV